MNFRYLALLVAFTPLPVVGEPLELPDLSGTTPIFCILPAADSDIVILAGREFSGVDAESWLKQTAEKFGNDDPVVLLFANDVTLAKAFSWTERAKKTHKNVWAIAFSKNTSEPTHLFSHKSIAERKMLEHLLSQAGLRPIPTPTSPPFKSATMFDPLAPLPTGPPPQYRPMDIIIPPPDELLNELTEQNGK